MPTYVCSVLENSVDEHQKDAIAEAIARVHSEETGAPKFFCQIVIDEKKPTSRYLGPSRSSGQIWVRGDIRGGRMVEQRTKLMLRMMEEISRITGVKQEEIWVYVCNVRRERSRDGIGRLKKGEFLAHRNVHRREDETANSIIQGTG